MNLKDYPITEDTHPFLARMVASYNSVNTRIPSRIELMETQYELWETEGHCTLESLCLQCGVEYKKEDEEV